MSRQLPLAALLLRLSEDSLLLACAHAAFPVFYRNRIGEKCKRCANLESEPSAACSRAAPSKLIHSALASLLQHTNDH